MVVKDCRVVEAKQRLKAESEQGALSSGTLVFDQMPGSPLLQCGHIRAPTPERLGVSCPSKVVCQTVYAYVCDFLDFRLWLPRIPSGRNGWVVLVAVSKITLNASFALGLDC